MARAKEKTEDAFHSLTGWARPGTDRAPVTRERVVRRALEVLDDEGFDGLTMRRLAERLDIKAASLYNHVKNKDQLLALVADAICGEVPGLNKSKQWRKQLEGIALQCRRVLMAHRDGARVLAATPPLGPNRLRIIEQVLDALVSAGFPAAEATDAAFVHNSYVVGFVLDETLGRTRGTASLKSMREEARRWFKSLSTEHYPTLVTLADELIDGTPDRRFEFGLCALLDGFELRLLKKSR